MKLNALAKVGLALSLMLISASCSATSRIRAAGAQIGRAEAGVTLPAWPAHCRAVVPHAQAVAGADAVSVLKLERAQLDFANTRARNCGAFYDRLKADLASNPQ